MVSTTVTRDYTIKNDTWDICTLCEQASQRIIVIQVKTMAREFQTMVCDDCVDTIFRAVANDD